MTNFTNLLSHLFARLSRSVDIVVFTDPLHCLCDITKKKKKIGKCEKYVLSFSMSVYVPVS